MDGKTFDAWTRRRLGLAAGSVMASLLGLAPLAGVTAKKKKKNKGKRKKPALPLPTGPTCSDGVKNGSETDVDCGGPTCPRCASGRSCASNTDCATARCGDAQGNGISCQACTSDGICGRDGNGGCLCDRPTGACYTDLTPTTFVNSCAACPPGTICRDYFEGAACIPLCGG